MLQSQTFRIISSLLLIGVMIFVGIFGSLIATLSGESDFYTPFIISVVVLLIIWLIAWSFRLLKGKVLMCSLIGIVLCAIAASCVYELRKNYINNIPTVNGQDVDLSEYQPFGPETKVTVLNDESTLKFTDNLPRVDGATALYPLYASFVQAIYPQREYDFQYGEVQGGTTRKAYVRLMGGDVDIIFCAAPSKEQVKKAAIQGITFVLTPIGKEAFVFFVNKENPVRNITSSQVQDIYSGKITNWKELGGKDDEIKAFQRPSGSGSQTMLEKIMGDTPLMAAPEERLVGGMGEIIERTATYKNFNDAIGYTFLFFATEMIKNSQIELLKIDGVYPDRNTIENGQYPFAGDFMP